MKELLEKFWGWYEQHYFLNLCVAGRLFLLQIVHLCWLATDVIATKLLGTSLFHLTGIWKYIIIAVDYTEIPALVTTSVLYLNEARKQRTLKSIFFLIFLNSQWLHLFWITDEFVLDALTGANVALPLSLAWVAILIDYLEVPVIIDVLKKIVVAVKRREFDRIHEALKEK
ncbi:MAG TPA: hypothetical protein VJH94_04630 [Candidatus Paceibacterota bacterium]